MKTFIFIILTIGIVLFGIIYGTPYVHENRNVIYVPFAFLGLSGIEAFIIYVLGLILGIWKK